MKRLIVIILVVLANATGVCGGVGRDFVIDGVYEAAMDLPRIYFVLQRKAEGPVLGQEGGEFEPKMAFLDTGCSGMMLSKDTADELGVVSDAKARFVEAGAGGEEIFHVTEPLVVGLADGGLDDPENRKHYELFGPGRFQVKQTPMALGVLSEAIDVVGMPVMLDRVVTLDSGATNALGYFAADIKKVNDPEIPRVDIKVALELKNCTNPSNPKNVRPLPAMAYNPFINGIVVSYHGKTCQGNWLLDTGASISFISTRLALELGLVDKDGNPKGATDFSVPMGGVGKMIQVAGFEVDELRVPTVSGNSLVFRKARIGVHDVRYFDEKKGAYVVLEGVFGSNFLCASVKMEGLLPSDISEAPFEHIVIDMKNKMLGFEVRDKANQKSKSKQQK